ncbi:hypothetical protein LSAT2_021526 [Lamellibrachia satsuma]|nr:hypothetical protein LSAT2_021526 [Lamellibrachia satsuma]
MSRSFLKVIDWRTLSGFIRWNITSPFDPSNFSIDILRIFRKVDKNGRNESSFNTVCLGPLPLGGARKKWRTRAKHLQANVSCESEWCPASCPEHTLSASKLKRGNSPFEPSLGDLSFEDYLFLRLFDRNF